MAQNPHKADQAGSKYRAALVLGVILSCFIALQCLLPLRTAVKIGADEGFELAKTTLWLKGYKLYTDVWNDQPPLHTYLMVQLVRHVTHSVLGPRVVTIVFALGLLSAVFLMALRVSGLLVAALATLWLIGSPAFVELSASVMLEIPALSLVAATLCLLMNGPARWHIKEVLSGLLFAAALQIKLIGVIYLPLAALILWLPQNAFVVPDNSSRNSILSRAFPRDFVVSASLFGASLVVGFVLIDWFVDDGAYLRHFQQSWLSHFGAAQSFERGSAAEHTFDWSVLLKNWDATLPAAVGVVVGCRRMRQLPLAVIPGLWLVLTLAVFATHRPWWSYYYVHTAVPLSWCAGVGLVGLIRWRPVRHQRLKSVAVAIFAGAAACWLGARVYLQVVSVRESPRIYTALVLPEIERFRPFTTFLYAEESSYSFYADIPLPPQLGVVPLKRFWSGEMTAARLTEELQSVQPGLLLLNNTTQELPIQELLNTQYRLIYEDTTHRLYAHQSVLARERQSRGR